jgi:arylsulfatase A-like enzyme
VDVFPTLASFAGIREGLPPGLEGGDLMPILSGRSQEPVRRARPEFVVHFPHYDKDPAGPASALILGNEKLVRFYETGASHLYDLAHDIGERRDLAAAKPERVRELDRMLTAYLGAVRAQMPSVNAAFDPKAPPPTTKRGGRKKEAK